MNHRGSLTLFKNIFEEPVVQVSEKKESIRQRKVDCMIDYYYFTARKTKHSYPNLLELLSDVFFLSTITISDIIQGNIDKLHALKEKYKSEENIDKIQKQFRNKWPHLVW